MENYYYKVVAKVKIYINHQINLIAIWEIFFHLQWKYRIRTWLNIFLKSSTKS